MPRQRVVFPQSNWKGMVYATDVGDIPPGYAWYVKNMVPTAGVYWRRPSVQNRALITSSTSAQGQGFFTLRTAAGQILVAVIAGEIYGTGVNDNTFSKLVSTANLTTASITLSNGGPVFAVQYGATLVFNDDDEANSPFTWDGTSGAGGLTKITNAPLAYGAPAVYYGKLFFIKASDQRTIVWSEENAANTGYEASGYSNAWTLAQMGSGPIHALLGLNDGLYYFRRTSIGVIRGAVTPDFSAAGVHDNVSLDLGTASPKGVCYHNGYIWFIDAGGHPNRISVGGYQVEPIWRGMQAAFWEQSEVTQTLTDDIVLEEQAVVPIPGMGIVWFCTNTGPSATAAPGRGNVADGGWFFDAGSGDCLCNFVLNYTSSGSTAIVGTGIVPGSVHTVGAGSNATQGVGFMVGTTGTVSGWSHLAFPLFGTSAYTVSWPDATTAIEIRSAPQGDVNLETRYHFSELRVAFVMGRVNSGTKTQAVAAQINTATTMAQSALTSQNISNSTTGLVSERITKTWGLSRELPYLTPGITVTTPVAVAWGVTAIDTVAYPLQASPAWSTT